MVDQSPWQFGICSDTSNDQLSLTHGQHKACYSKREKSMALAQVKATAAHIDRIATFEGLRSLGRFASIASYGV